ncbi:MAG: hypothetical protein MRERC_1c144 [Mycoplasmataceae bacterium RC_NB112A]|nr:MAG: hypothetical protein MRERC_1c144 [Mycoplasmataceae bacterium RC_NB112A]
MSPLRKLYKYYLGEIFRRNWLRITIVIFIVMVGWWFGWPYLLYRVKKRSILKELRQESELDPNSNSQVESEVSQWTFRNWSKVLFGKEVEFKIGTGIFKRSKEEFWKLNQEALTERIQELKEAKKEKDEKRRVKLEKEISDIVKSSAIFFFSPFRNDVVFFFCQTEGYRNGKSFFKLLNDISWWNLMGMIALPWLFFSTLNHLFFKGQKSGEETTILTFTPDIKRSDILSAKVLSFSTFYFIMNIFIFLLPFGFYYWWAGVNTSFSWFICLALWTTVIGPILFFGLIFAPYLFLKAKVSWLGWVISTLLSLFPIAWFWIKTGASSQTWLWSLENWFFDPAWFIPISLITGIIFMALYCWHYYKRQDLK